MNNWFEADRFSGTALVWKKDKVIFQNSYGYVMKPCLKYIITMILNSM